MDRRFGRDRFGRECPEDMSITLNIRCNAKTPRHIEINLCGDDDAQEDIPAGPRFAPHRDAYDPHRDHVWDEPVGFPEEEEEDLPIPPHRARRAPGRPAYVPPHLRMMDEDEFGADFDDCQDDSEEMMSSAFEIKFDFKDGDEDDLARLNQMLAVQKLTDVELRDYQGYLCTTHEFDPDENLKETKYRFGLAEGTLVCKKRRGEESYTYQIMTEVSEDAQIDCAAFGDLWRMAHPEYQIRMLSQQSYEDQQCFLVLYHEKTAEIPEDQDIDE